MPMHKIKLRRNRRGWLELRWRESRCACSHGFERKNFLYTALCIDISNAFMFFFFYYFASLFACARSPPPSTHPYIKQLRALFRAHLLRSAAVRTSGEKEAMMLGAWWWCLVFGSCWWWWWLVLGAFLWERSDGERGVGVLQACVC